MNSFLFVVIAIAIFGLFILSFWLNSPKMKGKFGDGGFMLFEMQSFPVVFCPFSIWYFPPFFFLWKSESYVSLYENMIDTFHFLQTC